MIPNEKEAKIAKIRKDTKEDVLYKLGRYGKCLIVRPPGYGKTYLLTDLITRYKKVLYLYPSAVVGQTVFDRYTDMHSDEFDGYIIKVTFTGFLGTEVSAEYEVYADSEDEAIENAIYDATFALTVTSFAE